jgi:hypothetical protein
VLLERQNSKPFLTVNIDPSSRRVRSVVQNRTHILTLSYAPQDTSKTSSYSNARAAITSDLARPAILTRTNMSLTKTIRLRGMPSLPSCALNLVRVR